VTRRLRLLAVVPALLAGLSACGTATLSADEVATKAEVGATTRCTLTGGEDPTKYGVSIKVTEVDGDNAKFDITVDDQPQG